MDSWRGFDPTVWGLMSDQLGLPGLIVPLAHGGSEAGTGELIAVFEEAGRVLLGTPLLASGVLAAGALVSLRNQAASVEYLPGIAAGTTIAAFAAHEYSTGTDHSEITATLDDGQWHLEGVARHVLDGQNADVLLVPVPNHEGASLFLIDGRDPSVHISALATLDQTIKQADIELNACPARLLGDGGRAVAAVERSLALGALAVSAQAIGGAERTVESSVEYATQRIQFGRIIGEFQAIKHKCADMKLRLETARAAVHKAANSLADMTQGAHVDVSVAKVYACDAFFQIAAENIQIHGGIGCTWEHPAHLYLRRAKTLQHLLGSPTHHRSVIARHLHLA